MAIGDDSLNGPATDAYQRFLAVAISNDSLNSQFSDSLLADQYSPRNPVTAVFLPYAPSDHSFHFLAVVKHSLHWRVD